MKPMNINVSAKIAGGQLVLERGNTSIRLNEAEARLVREYMNQWLEDAASCATMAVDYRTDCEK